MILQVSIPPEALQPIWTDNYRKSWGQKLQSSSTPEELLQVRVSIFYQTVIDIDFWCEKLTQ